MSCRKWGLRAASVLAALAITAVSPAAYSSMKAKADSLSDSQKKLDALNSKVAEDKKAYESNQSDLQSSKNLLNDIQQRIDANQSLIDSYNSQIDDINGQIQQLSDDIAQKEQEVSEKQDEVAVKFQQLRERLQAISKTGNMSSLQMLMDTDNYTDYLIKSKMMERVAENDKKLMDELEAEIDQVNGEKAAIEEQKTEQTQKEADVQSKIDGRKAANTQLTSDYASKTTLLQQQQSATDKSAAALQQDVSDRDDEQVIVDEIKAAQAAANSSSGGSSGASSSGYKYDGGTMFWPVPAVHNISSGFGMRWGTLHKGIDIANGSVPIYGQNIVAAADGVVIYANGTDSWGGGYGYHVIIDHGQDSSGRDIKTVYAHCSKVLVSAGDHVVGGQTVIARAGATGDVTGPHLHFEVRVNNVAVDPIKNGYIKVN